MCQDCSTRISDKTKARIDTGNFRFYRTQSEKDDW
jgi:uncharacterized protein YlaI